MGHELHAASLAAFSDASIVIVRALPFFDTVSALILLKFRRKPRARLDRNPNGFPWRGDRSSLPTTTFHASGYVTPETANWKLTGSRTRS
jgi:hypothetical protein